MQLCVARQRILFFLSGCHSPLSPSEKQSPSWSPHVADVVDFHTLVGEHGDVSHDSLMGVVGRDQARRGQPVAKPVAQSVTEPMPVLDIARCWHEGKFVGDDDKLLVEYQEDIDIDIGIEAELPMLEVDQEFDYELKDCFEVPRRVS